MGLHAALSPLLLAVCPLSPPAVEIRTPPGGFQGDVGACFRALALTEAFLLALLLLLLVVVAVLVGVGVPYTSRVRRCSAVSIDLLSLCHLFFVALRAYKYMRICDTDISSKVKVIAAAFQRGTAVCCFSAPPFAPLRRNCTDALPRGVC